MKNIKTYFTKFMHPIALCCFTHIFLPYVYDANFFSVDASFFFSERFLGNLIFIFVIVVVKSQ